MYLYPSHDHAELQIRKGKRIIKGKFSIFLRKNIFCDLSLEPSHRDGSNGGSQHMFLLTNKKRYLFISDILVTSLVS